MMGCGRKPSSSTIGLLCLETDISCFGCWVTLPLRSDIDSKLTVNRCAHRSPNVEIPCRFRTDGNFSFRHRRRNCVSGSLQTRRFTSAPIGKQTCISGKAWHPPGTRNLPEIPVVRLPATVAPESINFAGRFFGSATTPTPTEIYTGRS